MRPETMKPRPIDPIAALDAGFSPDEAQKLAGVRDWGLPEVARTVDTEGQGGSKMVQQLDKFGRPIGAGLPGYVPPQLIDQGDRKTFAKPAVGMSFPMSMSPEQRDASARGWANVRIAQQNAALEAGGSRPPPGYRWQPDGSLSAIPGGPADIKATAAAQKDEARKNLNIENAQSVLQTISEAKNLVGYTTAGIGGYSAALPATEGRNLQAKLTTIKANLGFDRLQAMREASPTGGALGQVAVQELQSLQATVASLDQLQSPTQLKAALDKIERHYSNWLNTVTQQGGGGGEWGGPKAGDVQDGHKFKGGDPSKSENWEKL